MTKQTLLLPLAILGLLPGIARADFQISGVFQYEKRPQVFTALVGQPCWLPLENRPIRYAHVQVINASTNAVLLEGSTDANGAFSGIVPGGGQPTVSVFVRCYAHTSPGQFGPQVFNVTDANNVEYAVKSNLYRNWNTQQVLNFGTVIAHGVTVATVVGHPFNDFDNLVWMLSYFESMSGYHPTVPLTVAWPGTTWDGRSHYLLGNHTVAIALASGTDNDSIELHEMGHYLLDSYGAGSPVVGDHDLEDTNQDPGLSFGEGMATLLEGLVRKFRGDFDPGYYSKCTPDGGVSNGGYRFENGDGFGLQLLGEGSEAAVTMSLWDIADTNITQDGDNVDDDPVDGSFLFQELLTGEQLIWETMTGVLPTLPYGTTQVLENLWNGFSVPVDWGHQQELLGVLVPWGMLFQNDAWEPDNTPDTATPLAVSSWSPVHTLYYSANIPAVPGSGDSDFFSFTPVVGQEISVRTAYPNDSCIDIHTDVDPYVVVRNRYGTKMAEADSGGQCPPTPGVLDRNALVTFTPDVAGPYTIEVKASQAFAQAYRRTGSYQVMWQYTIN